MVLVVESGADHAGNDGALGRRADHEQVEVAGLIGIPEATAVGQADRDLRDSYADARRALIDEAAQKIERL